MYARNITHNLVPTQHNLKSILPENCTQEIRRHYSRWNQKQELKDKLEALLEQARKLKNFVLSRTNPEETLKSWAQQFEFVIAHRVRRGQQMICLYSRWWDERALQELLRRMRLNVNRNGREFIVGALGVSLFNWEENRIPDTEFNAHLDDLGYIAKLKNATVCHSCDIDRAQKKNTRICECGSAGISDKTYDDWAPFIEKDDLMVWRRPHGTEGLFEYKVFGSYNDVSAEDFLNVQIDTDYRKDWDTTAVQLVLGEQDSDPESNSDILYWEMQWPRFFTNRDYVFNRRYKVFKESKTIVIINKTTEYPKFPKYPDKYRVEEYWSCMVVKPYEHLNHLGIEFSLTYFDNPGVNIPASITAWVAKSAMPDYLARLRQAGRNYHNYCLEKGTSKACVIYQEEERKKREEEEKDKLGYCSNERLRLVFEEIYEEYKKKANKRIRFFKKKSDMVSPSGDKILERPLEEITPPSPVALPTSRSFWRYLHPMYYFS